MLASRTGGLSVQLSIIPQSFQVLAPILISRTTIPAAPALVSKGQLSCSAVLAASPGTTLGVQGSGPPGSTAAPTTLNSSTGHDHRFNFGCLYLHPVVTLCWNNSKSGSACAAQLSCPRNADPPRAHSSSHCFPVRQPCTSTGRIRHLEPTLGRCITGFNTARGLSTQQALRIEITPLAINSLISN